ncbi:SNF2 family N-terminal domain-containing protein [Entophlyctis helioformis]|nr:SNF2 family N-terminal domain-containing protein [Entophlyctis helioformis]
MPTAYTLAGPGQRWCKVGASGSGGGSGGSSGSPTGSKRRRVAGDGSDTKPAATAWHSLGLASVRTPSRAASGHGSQLFKALAASPSSASTAATPAQQTMAPAIQFPALVGDMTVTAVSLCKGFNMAKCGARVILSRTAPKTPKSGRGRPAASASSGRGNPVFNRSSASAVDNQHTIVRVYLEDGSEIGRLSSDVARIVSTLLDQNLCLFDGTILYANNPITIMDDILISLNVSFVKDAFPRNLVRQTAAVKDDGPDSSLRVRLRKHALNSMFVRVGIESHQDASDPEQAGLAGESLGSLGSSNGLATSGAISPSDLAQLYRKANQLDKAIGSMQPSDGMKLQLHDYQAVALAFMYSKENKASMNSEGMSPLWKKYEMKTGDRFYYNRYSGELSLEFPRESHCSGGILADEMGLGKTIEMLSLIHTSRAVRSPMSQISSSVPSSHATLIVCPLNLLAQWRDEALRAFEPGLVKPDIYYGNDRSRPDAPLIVITTYGTLASEHAKNREDSPLYAIQWHRIVLDEAHYIKERTTRSAKAAYDLIATNRWAVSGTPIVNKLEYPWCQYSFWNSFITIPFEKRDPAALDVVQTIMEPLIIRRTKDMRKEDGSLIVELPAKHIDIKYLSFNKEEQDIYNSLQKYTSRKLYDLKIIGKADYLRVFHLILRLRQVCDHPILVKAKDSAGSGDGGTHAVADGKEVIPLVMELDDLIARYCSNGSSEFAMQVVNDLRNTGSRECPICEEPYWDGVILPCLHIVCKPCIDSWFEMKQSNEEDMECTLCRMPCSEADMMRILASRKEDETENVSGVHETDASSDSRNANDSKTNDPKEAPSTQPSSSSEDAGQSATLPTTQPKIMLQSMQFRSDLESIRSKDTSEKSVVFSQWTSFLDLAEIVLKQNGFVFARIDGSLSQKAREKVLHTFKTDPSTTILLASLKSTGVGLNLTAASRVFMLDPWWNESAEFQAIDRVHRLGQTRPVFVTRYIISNSIEEKMLAIQHRKAQLAGAVTDASNSEHAKLDELMALFD